MFKFNPWQVQQRGVQACTEIIESLLSGVTEPGKTYKIFLVDTWPTRPLGCATMSWCSNPPTSHQILNNSEKCNKPGNLSNPEPSNPQPGNPQPSNPQPSNHRTFNPKPSKMLKAESTGQLLDLLPLDFPNSSIE